MHREWWSDIAFVFVAVFCYIVNLFNASDGSSHVVVLARRVDRDAMGMVVGTEVFLDLCEASQKATHALWHARTLGSEALGA